MSLINPRISFIQNQIDILKSNLRSESQKVNIKSMTSEEKQRFNTTVQEIMRKMEFLNQTLAEEKNKVNKDSKKLEQNATKLLLESQRYFNREIANNKTEPKENKSLEMIREAKQKLSSCLEKLTKTHHKEKEEQLLDSLEEILLKGTKEEREMIAKMIEMQFGESKLTRKIINLLSKGSEYGKKYHLLDQDTIEGMELGCMILEGKQIVVNEATKLVRDPGKKTREWLKTYLAS